MEVTLKKEIGQLKAALEEKDSDIAQLKQELETLRLSNSHPVLNDEEQKEAYKQLELICTEQKEKIENLETDQEDLFLCLADQEIEIENLKTRLKGYGEVFEE